MRTAGYAKMNPAIEKELHEQLDLLTVEQQRQLLDFARALAQTTPNGKPGQTLRRFAGTIPPDDLAVIARAIEDGCEQVNTDEW